MRTTFARQFNLLAAGTAVLLAAGCDPSDSVPAAPQNVTINFQAKAGSTAIGCDTAATAMGVTVDKTLQINDFRFYVSMISLIDAGGNRVPVTLDENAWQMQHGDHSIALMDFTNKDSACSGAAKAMHTAITGTVPAGTYSGIEFELGVPEGHNHSSVATAEAPLDVLAMNWSWQSGRKFVKLESSWDNAGTPVNQTFHLGSTGCTGGDAAHPESVTCTSPYRPKVTLSSFDVAGDVIVADYKTLLASTDLSTGLMCMPGASAACQGITAIAGADASGFSNGTQAFFRVE